MIRDQVLRAIALNRQPGLHFAGNLAEISFESREADDARVTIEPSASCIDADGQTNIGLVAMVADMGLATSIRASLHPATRLATVSLSMQFTGARLEGILTSRSQFQGFFGTGSHKQGLSRSFLTNPAGVVAFAQGAFMPMPPPPGVELFPLPRGRREAPQLQVRELSATERKLLRRADKALADGECGFIRRFFGYEPRATAGGASCTMPNGSHLGNRVGHVQGGLLMGLAATTAMAALPAHWALSSITSFFVSPGQGKALRARSRVIHQGQMTAVVRTEITGPEGRRVLDSTTSHARR